ncbi:MAG: choice-of-anchor D domain-containing protein [Proteobacteria bacterium]|nr:choice-of-anchor D domain-containing protein [Pseudomonadota bacterium]
MNRALLLILMAALLAGCPPERNDDDDDDADDDDSATDDDDVATDDDDAAPRAEIDIDPVTLDFGSVDVGDVAGGEVRVVNVGEDTLQIQALELSAGPFAVTNEGSFAQLLAPGDATLLELSFTPVQHGEASGELLILSNDPSRPEAEVALEGGGIAPEIELSPPSYDFGNHQLGCSGSLELGITNVGSVPLTVTAVEYADLAGTGELTLTHALTFPLELAPGQGSTLTIDYVPVNVEPDSGILTVASNDPTEPSAQAQQFGIAHLGAAGIDSFTQADPATDTFALSLEPVVETIEVRLNGVPVYVGWTYEAVGNAVVFDEEHVPENGDGVEVEYTSAVCVD